LLNIFLHIRKGNILLDIELFVLYNVIMKGGVDVDFLEKLDFLMYKGKLNKKKLSEQSDIPYTTIVGWYKRGYSNMSLLTFKKICDYFGVTMDCMARDEVSEIEYYSPKKKNLHITPEEELLVKCYRAADDLDKTLALRAVKADEEESFKKQGAG
jgi:hypothetical protein